MGETAALSLAWAWAGHAQAQAASQPSSPAPQPTAAQPATDELTAYRQRIEAAEKALADQARQLAEQRARLDAQNQEIQALKSSIDSTLDSIRAAGRPAGVGAIATINAGDVGGSAPPVVSASPTNGPVGEAPPPQPTSLALPQGINVLTQPGHLRLEVGADYQNSSSDRLVFEGVQIAGAVLIGVIQANQTANNSFIEWNNLYFGVTPRFEIDASIPYVDRTNRVTTVENAQTQLTRTFRLNGSGLGDVQVTGRYQITAGRPGEPILIGNLTVKSNTGRGPYSVPFDAAGAALALPVGSGFWAIEPSLSWIYPSDPVVLFGSLGYQHSFGYNLNKTIGGATVQSVRPGDAISAAIGFSFALNQRFSYSLGFKNDFFFPTKTQISGFKATSASLEAGSLLVGGSYNLTKHLALNLNFEFGVTPDAPNTTILFRLPYTF
ncbi:MAG: transporter [Caulobacteraceae bacterium]|nr:transporter [Caulobacteraceae bacterium]